MSKCIKMFFFTACLLFCKMNFASSVTPDCVDSENSSNIDKTDKNEISKAIKTLQCLGYTEEQILEQLHRVNTNSNKNKHKTYLIPWMVTVCLAIILIYYFANNVKYLKNENNKLNDKLLYAENTTKSSADKNKELAKQLAEASDKESHASQLKDDYQKLIHGVNRSSPVILFLSEQAANGAKAILSHARALPQFMIDELKKQPEFSDVSL